MPLQFAGLSSSRILRPVGGDRRITFTARCKARDTIPYELDILPTK
jgi:hypothetical protein